MTTNTQETTKKVKVVPGRATNLATAVRSHLNAAMAYMRLGDEDCMEAEWDSLDYVLRKLKKQAYQNVNSQERGRE